MRKHYTTYFVWLIIMIVFINGTIVAQDDCPDNLIHYWNFNNIGTGSFTDQVGNLDISVTEETETVLGRIDSAQYFSGMSELDIPDHIDFDWGADASFTIEFWVNKSSSCPSNSGNNNNVILGRDDPNTQLHWWVGISCQNPGKVHFTLLANNGEGITMESKRGIIDGNWHLVSVVRDGAAQTNSIFIDGVMDTTASFTYTSDFFSITPINVGWLNLGSKYHFQGTLDELAFYNASLQASDFLAHFNSGIGKAYCGNSVGNDTSSFNISIDFEEMTPHIGQKFTAYLKETSQNHAIDSFTINSIEDADFNVTFGDLTESGDFTVDFWADLNQNGLYDSPPADHAWRLNLGPVNSDTNVVFVHNTDFTDIFETGTDTTDTAGYMIHLNFTGMSQSVGKDLTVYLIEHGSDEFADSVFVNMIDSTDITVSFDSVPAGDYNLDFWTDLNENDRYDVPPVDHAWRIVLMNVMSDTIVNFTYNTDFTDIFETDTSSPDTGNYQLVLNFTGFTDNIGQNLVVYLKDPVNQTVVDSVEAVVDSADFNIVFDSVAVKDVYIIDFYTDVNNNGNYDVPPVDQAWRIELNNVNIDTTVVFVYNTDYTDIGIIIVGVDDQSIGKDFNLFPNPVRSTLQITLHYEASEISIYSITGSLLMKRSLNKTENTVLVDVASLKSGVYILRLKSEKGYTQQKFTKE